jgi:adenylate cyclase
VARIPAFLGRPVGRLLLRGKTRPLGCFEPLAAVHAGANSKYCAAFALLEAGDPRSRQAFAALVGETDEDPLALFHLGRLLRGEAGCEIAIGEA